MPVPVSPCAGDVKPHSRDPRLGASGCRAGDGEDTLRIHVPAPNLVVIAARGSR